MKRDKVTNFKPYCIFMCKNTVEQYINYLFVLTNNEDNIVYEQ